jgi:hypothetical protein
VIRKLKPVIPKNAIVTEPLAAVKRRLRKRLTSSIGSGALRSRRMKAANSPAATAKPARVRPLLQPWLGASISV